MVSQGVLPPPPHEATHQNIYRLPDPGSKETKLSEPLQMYGTVDDYIATVTTPSSTTEIIS